jgi:hypothetical protein
MADVIQYPVGYAARRSPHGPPQFWRGREFPLRRGISLSGWITSAMGALLSGMVVVSVEGETITRRLHPSLSWWQPVRGDGASLRLDFLAGRGWVCRMHRTAPLACAEGPSRVCIGKLGNPLTGPLQGTHGVVPHVCLKVIVRCPPAGGAMHSLHELYAQRR